MAAAISVDELNQAFGIEGVLRFELSHGLPCAQITTGLASATVFLQGAHVTHWQPAGEQPVLFLSDRSDFAEGKAIRGGVPICWPWFGARGDGQPGPSHGFARLQPWTVEFAALAPGEAGAAEEVTLIFALRPSETSRGLGFDDFLVQYRVRVGRTLTLTLTVMNPGQRPLRSEQALHAYVAVSDVRQCGLTGLEAAPYLDKTDSLREKQMPEGPAQLEAETDRVFPGAEGPVTVTDPGWARQVTTTKRGSRSTIVWNPWQTGAAKMADLAPDAWPGFVCVETANVGADAIALEAGQAHSLSAEIALVRRGG